MRFLLVMAEEDHFDRWEASGPADREAVVAAFEAFDAAVRKRGSIVAGEALTRPDEARTVRPGHATVTDGPFAETVEQVGGFYLLDVPDLETAVDLARLLPTSYSVEVRPVLEVDF